MRISSIFGSLLITVFFAFNHLNAQSTPYADYLHDATGLVSFEENLGQFESDIRYQCNQHLKQVRFLEEGLSIALIKKVEDSTAPAALPKYRQHQEPESGWWEALVWNLRLRGADSAMELTPYAARNGLRNYLREGVRVTSVQRFEELWYQDAYPGISMRYYGQSEDDLKYDFVLEPAADPSDIQLNLSGIDSLALDSSG
ncbi:MAG: hypothetical protein AAF804_10155, partial [Bacteroidota bacterium]